MKPLLLLHHCHLEIPLSQQIQQDCYQVLNVDEKRQLQTFINPIVQNRFLLSRCLLHHGLSKCSQRLPHEWRFVKNQHGKPELEGFQNQTNFGGCLDFNLSHSGDWIALAFADVKVGVDIQKIKPDVSFLKIAKRFFHVTERQKLQARGTLHQPNEFFKLWTLKEAYLKAVGTGIAGGMSSFVFDGNEHDGKGHLFSHHTWKLGEQYMLSLVLFDQTSQISVVFCNHLAQPTSWKPQLSKQDLFDEIFHP